MRHRLAVAVTAIVAVLVACGEDKPPGAVTSPPPQAGFTRIIGSGFTIDMPAGWQQPNLDPAAYEQTAGALRARNPQLADALDRARASIGSDSRFFAIDPTDGSSVNLIVTSAGNRSLKTVVADAVRGLQQLGVGTPREEPTTVGRHTAVRLEFTLSVTGSSGTLTVPETQYYVVRDKRLYVLTLFGGSPTLGVVAESLRIE